MFVQIILDFIQYGFQFHWVKGFEQIFRYAQSDGFFGIGKFVVPADDDGLERQPSLGCFLQKNQTIHNRHGNVRDNDVWMAFFRQLKRLFSVDGTAHHFQIGLRTADIANQKAAHFRFVLYDQYSVHLSFSCMHLGIVSVARVHSPSQLS